MKRVNRFVLENVSRLEMVGVVMRIISFSIVSWLGPASPFLFAWVFNTADAVLLSYCATLRRDRAYTLLNGFWVIVGVVGILRARGFIA